ncbi:MAG: hypothetical protein ACRD4Q_01465 [Candidatus Acidiferrales bacterium]
MKLKNHAGDIATIVLAGVCVVLIIRLLVRVNAVAATAVPAQPIQSGDLAASALHRPPKADPEGPFLNVDLYQQLEDQSLPAPERDPFTFAPTPEEIQAASRAREPVEATGGAPAAPPLPPFTAVGYSQAASGQLQAYLSGDQRVWVVHQGDQFDKKYAVVKITPAMIEIRDESLERTSELPIPQ